MAGGDLELANAGIRRSLKKFQAEVDEFAKKLVPEQLVAFQTKITLEALRRIVLKTPVDTGRARGNWQTTIGQPAEDEKLSGNPTEDGAVELKKLGPFEVVFIVNNVPYIVFLENGSSQQAPQGMVALTIEELRGLFGE